MATTRIKFNPDVHIPIVKQAISEQGASIEQVSRAIGISRNTFYRWMDTYPDLYAAVQEGRTVVVEIVENALFRSARGIEYVETKTVTEQTTVTGIGEEEGIKRLPAELVKTEKVKKFVPPNVEAGKFILKNLAPDKWKDKQEMDVKHDGSIEFKGLTLEELMKLDTKQLAQLYSEARSQPGPP